MLDPRERRARRDYRQSLPPLYRWRRVLVGVGIAAAAAGALAVAQRDPVALARDTWHGFRGEIVQLTPSALPLNADLEVDGSPANNLVDDDPQTSWASAWTASGKDAGCPGSTQMGQVLLRFDSARVRQIRVVTGVVDEATRGQQPIPVALAVTFAGQECRVVPISAEATEQRLDVDSDTAVGEATIGLATISAATDEAPQTPALSEVSLWSRP